MREIGPQGGQTRKIFFARSGLRAATSRPAYSYPSDDSVLARPALRTLAFTGISSPPAHCTMISSTFQPSTEQENLNKGNATSTNMAGAQPKHQAVTADPLVGATMMGVARALPLTKVTDDDTRVYLKPHRHTVRTVNFTAPSRENRASTDYAVSASP